MRLSFICFALVCLTAASVSSESLQAQDMAKTAETRVIDVSADHYAFTPAEIHVKKGTHVQIKVHSVDKSHGLRIDPYAEGADKKGAPGLRFAAKPESGKVKKGEEGSLEFVAEQTGTYEFKCSVQCGFGHGRMKGKLIVEE